MREILQEWECIVASIKQDCVKCEMHDLTDLSMPIEYAEIYLDKFDPSDKDFLCEGNSFHWAIGNEVINGTIKKFSSFETIKPRQLSILEKSKIKEMSKKLYKLLSGAKNEKEK